MFMNFAGEVSYVFGEVSYVLKDYGSCEFMNFMRSDRVYECHDTLNTNYSLRIDVV